MASPHLPNGLAIGNPHNDGFPPSPNGVAKGNPHVIDNNIVGTDVSLIGIADAGHGHGHGLL
jgi:hypothetical protein